MPCADRAHRPSRHGRESMTRYLAGVVGTFVIGGLVSIAGCAADNPLHCEDDSECRDISWKRYDPKKPECHFQGHFCYEGCDTNADCADTSKPWYNASHARCDPLTRDCVPGGDGATPIDGGLDSDGPGTDMDVRKEPGDPCSGAAECKSGHCVDQVCCKDDCSGSCMACNVDGSKGTCALVPDGQDPDQDCAGSTAACDGVCNGSGTCRFPGSTTFCGSPSCSAGELTQHTCDGTGGCSTSNLDCGGYACNTAGDACKTLCAGDGDCTGSFYCDAPQCKNALPNGDSCGTNDAACASGHCVDGLCCNNACAGTCESCALTKGTCTAVPAGQDPRGDCPGDTSTGSTPCGNGTCDGSKACSYPNAGKICDHQCASGSHTPSTCSATHQCTAGTPTSCGAYLCNPATNQCHAGCSSDHSECVSSGVCDRAAAHGNGLGLCLGTSSVDWVVANGDIGAVVANTSKPVVAVPAGTYTAAITIGKTVKLIGTGTSSNPTKIDPSADGPAITVQAGTTVGLQGLTVQGATGTATGIGVNCAGAVANTATLTVVESTINDNKATGVNATYCDVTLRRNQIQNNQGGGADLNKGTFIVVNNLVTNNGTKGTGGTSLGGFNINAAASLTFTSNTVADNEALTGTAAGVICTSSSYSLQNSIIWGNIGDSSQVLTCTFTYSDVEGSTGGTGNVDVNPTFDTAYKPGAPACFNSGNSSAAGLGKLDLAGGVRIKGTKIDMGAYEVQ